MSIGYWLTLNSHIVVVVRLRVIVILNHRESAHVADLGSLSRCTTHSGHRAPIRQVPMDRKVGIVLELKLLGMRVREVA